MAEYRRASAFGWQHNSATGGTLYHAYCPRTGLKHPVAVRRHFWQVTNSKEASRIPVGDSLFGFLVIAYDCTNCEGGGHEAAWTECDSGNLHYSGIQSRCDCLRLRCTQKHS